MGFDHTVQQCTQQLVKSDIMIDRQIKELGSDTPTEVIIGLFDSIKAAGPRIIPCHWWSSCQKGILFIKAGARSHRQIFEVILLRHSII